MGGRGSSSSLGKSRYKIGEPMSDKHIAKAEALGLKRWSKGGHDRLYISPENVGYEISRYNTGNISSASYDGEKISNSKMARYSDYSQYVDVKTGELHMRNYVKYPEHEERVRDFYEKKIKPFLR